MVEHLPTELIKEKIPYQIKAGREWMQAAAIRNMLKDTYWASERTENCIEKSLKQSICVGAFEQLEGRQIGFVRAITDYATFYYVADMVVDERFRKRGVGREMMELLIRQPELEGLRGILITQSPVARKLYEKAGFEVCETTFMEKRQKE